MSEINNKIWLKEITNSDNLEGLRLLQEIVNEEGVMVAPAPKDID